MAYHGDKCLHIGAVTIVNNSDHTLHYAIAEEIKSQTFFMVVEECGCYYFKGLILVSSLADLDRTKNQRTNGPVNAHLRSAVYTNKHV